jgi:eukaryotic-like serine/threonine-protein kinase
MKLCLNCHKQFTDEVELCPHEGSFLVPLPNDPLIGALIDERYRVESLIAKGAVGSVYKAKQELLGRQVALKVLHGYLGADPESLVRFHREAKAISRLEHPNLLTLYDFGMTSDGQPYFVMDLLNGTTLAKVLSSEGRLEPKRAISIVKQVLEALSEAHKKGIVHRDIKPPNIVLVEKEETKDFVKLVDFSIAKMADNSTVDPVQLTVDGIICGSPAYMSPEQCRGADVDGRSDIYSIGIVLFEALTGKTSFFGERPGQLDVPARQ